MSYFYPFDRSVTHAGETVVLVYLPVGDWVVFRNTTIMIVTDRFEDAMFIFALYSADHPL